MGIKGFLTKKMMERQLKNMPEEQRKLFMRMFEENPDLFEKIAKEVQEKKKGGQDEMLATASVMRKYQSEMQELIKKIRHTT